MNCIPVLLLFFELDPFSPDRPECARIFSRKKGQSHHLNDDFAL